MRPGYEPATQSLAALARLGDQQPGMRPGPASNGQRPGMRSGMRPARSRPAPLALPPAPAAPAASAAGPASAAPPVPRVNHSGGQARPPLPMDDDPLTSPSFPAINTSDSRSYRT